MEAPTLALVVDSPSPSDSWRFDTGLSVRVGEVPALGPLGGRCNLLEVEDLEAADCPLRSLMAPMVRRGGLAIKGRTLALGQAERLDPIRLESLASIVRRFAPVSVCQEFSDGGPRPNLRWLAGNLDQARQRLSRPILVCVTAYLANGDLASIAATIHDRGCHLRIGMGQMLIAAARQKYQPARLLDQTLDCLPPGSTIVLELPGDVAVASPGGWFDPGAQSASDRDLLWRLYVRALQRLGPTPTVFSWPTSPRAQDLEGAIDTARTIMVCVSANREFTRGRDSASAGRAPRNGSFGARRCELAG